jgi:hypothetical protein
MPSYQSYRWHSAKNLHRCDYPAYLHHDETTTLNNLINSAVRFVVFKASCYDAISIIRMFSIFVKHVEKFIIYDENEYLKGYLCGKVSKPNSRNAPKKGAA